MPKRDEMEKIKEAVLNLTESPLYAMRVETGGQVVIGEGSVEAKILFVGEAPGKNEAKTGRPFCGASGKMLDQLLAHVGLDLERVYITNIVKDRPPENRDPTSEEIALYGPFLDAQIDLIRPKVIATLGRISMKYLFERFGIEDQLSTISNIHGQVFAIDAGYGPITLIPLFHPAAAIYNRSNLPLHVADIEMLMEHVS